MNRHDAPWKGDEEVSERIGESRFYWMAASRFWATRAARSLAPVSR